MDAPEAVTAGQSPAIRSVAKKIATTLGGLWSRQPTLIFVLSLISGLFMSAIVIVISTAQLRTAWGALFTDPGGAFATTFDFLGSAYGALLRGAIANPAAFSRAFAHPSALAWSQAFTPIGNTIVAAVPQVIMGGVGASWVGFSFAGMPWLPHVLLAFAAAAVGGGVAGLIPGVLKAATGASEVIVTIMLNCIAASFLTGNLSIPLLDKIPVGESPAAAESSGLNVRRLRYLSVATAGAIGGAGGAYFTVGSTGQFVAQMTSGLGYVALAAVILGSWRPAQAAPAALLFGFASSIATTFGLMKVSISPSLLLMIPYAVTIIVVAGVAGAGRPPAAAGGRLGD
jgi:ABC-type uncharacterized transport system permease subunit